jgi:RNA polymerase sigma factor (TIGR02999 family)
MRNILVERAKKRCAVKHGGGCCRVGLEAVESSTALAVEEIDFVSLDEALTALEEVSPEAAQVVMLRYFAGLSTADVAQAMHMSNKTVQGKWEYAKAWLHRRLESDSAR